MKDIKEAVFETDVMPILFPKKDCAERVVGVIEQTKMPVVQILQCGDDAKDVLKEACRNKRKTHTLMGMGLFSVLTGKKLYLQITQIVLYFWCIMKCKSGKFHNQLYAIWYS